MSEITKLFSAAALLAGGFFGASLFGPPTGPSPAGALPGQPAMEMLQPLDQTTQLPAAAASMWDSQVAPVGHTTNDRYAQRDAERAAAQGSQPYEVARPTWPPADVPPADAKVNFGSPSPSSFSSNDAGWPPSIARDTSNSTPLAPPPLLNQQIAARPMRPSSFPQQPQVAAAPLAIGQAPDFGNPSGFDSQPSSNFDTSFDRGFGGPALAAPSLGSRDAWQSTSPAPMAPSISAAPASSDEPIWHVVSDGDSLAKLAERYLGDANRAREIYELNRDVLMSPDLLTIGAQLRIPQRPTPPRFEVFDASGHRSERFAPQSRLVPLPALPDSVYSQPRARLQGPVSATLSATGG